MNHCVKTWRLALLGLYVLGLSGCRTVTQAVVQTMRRTGALPASGQSLVKGLTPQASGPGIVVCEAQSAPADKDFAAGCGRWLFVQIGGQGAFGQTPMWGAVDEARRQLGFANLRLGQPDALNLAKTLGATDVATGKLEGAGNALKLTYQVSGTSGTPTGAPLVISGSREQIIKDLPQLARQICTKLGETKPIIGPCELNAAELALVGRAPWKVRRTPPAGGATNRALQALAPRSPLASLLLWRGLAMPNVAAATPILQSCMAKSPSNTLILGDMGWVWSQYTQLHAKPVAALLKKYPRNSMLNLAQTRLLMVNGSAARATARKSAETAVRCAPNNFLTWLELANAINAQSEDVRHSRFTGQMSRQESGQVNALYPLWVEAAQQAIKINPGSTFCWKELSVASAFNGDMATAKTAIARAIALDPLNSDAYGWALQLAQPKWGGSAADVVKYANMQLANAAQMQASSHSLIEAYNAHNIQDKLEPLLAQLIKANPLDAAALYEYGAILHYQKRQYAEAEPLYRRALAVESTHARCLSSLADLQLYVHHDLKAAEALYRRAIAADPQFGFHRANLARLLQRTGRRAEALAEADKAKQLGFHDASHSVWGELNISP